MSRVFGVERPAPIPGADPRLDAATVLHRTILSELDRIFTSELPNGDKLRVAHAITAPEFFENQLRAANAANATGAVWAAACASLRAQAGRATSTTVRRILSVASDAFQDAARDAGAAPHPFSRESAS